MPTGEKGGGGGLRGGEGGGVFKSFSIGESFAFDASRHDYMDATPNTKTSRWLMYILCLFH